MPLNFTPLPIEQQLRQTIRKMGDFLTDNPSDECVYNTLYTEIEKLSTRARAEGWSGYKHQNPHKTLTDFIDSDDINKLMIKYYSIPILSRKLVNLSKAEKIKNNINWVSSSISKILSIVKNI